MSRITKLCMLAVALACCVSVQAGVMLDVAVGVNSQGNDIYTVTANSDDAPITSLYVNIVGDGNISVDPSGAVMPGFPCPFGDICILPIPPFPPFPGPVDAYTYLLFNVIDDALLVVAGFEATPDLFDVGVTGFAPFQSRAILQIVLTGGDAVATLGVVAGGVEYSIVPTAQGSNSALVPEPVSLTMLAAGSLMLIRRR